jgi:hypothetical protein
LNFCNSHKFLKLNGLDALAYLLQPTGSYLIRLPTKRINLLLGEAKIMKNIRNLSIGLLLATALTGAAYGQQTVTTTTTATSVKKVVQNEDGSYSVIEYPTGKEVMVNLMPTDKMMKATGTARIMRMDDQTTVNLDLSGLDNNSNYYVYAVDPAGNTTYLGPVTGENGLAKTSFTTPLNQFMLVLSPTEGLTTVGSDTTVAFRSNVPKGYAVVPAGGKQTRTTTVASTYEVPLLGIPSFKNGTTKKSMRFGGKLQGVKAEAYITPTKGGSTKIVMGFGNMKLGPADARYVLWAVSPDKQYTKIGQAIATGANDHSEIRGETILPDFGLFVTVENTDVTQPTSTMYSTYGLDQ